MGSNPILLIYFLPFFAKCFFLLRSIDQEHGSRTSRALRFLASVVAKSYEHKSIDDTTQFDASMVQDDCYFTPTVRMRSFPSVFPLPVFFSLAVTTMLKSMITSQRRVDIKGTWRSGSVGSTVSSSECHDRTVAHRGNGMIPGHVVDGDSGNPHAFAFFFFPSFLIFFSLTTATIRSQ